MEREPNALVITPHERARYLSLDDAREQRRHRAETIGPGSAARNHLQQLVGRRDIHLARAVDPEAGHLTGDSDLIGPVSKLGCSTICEEKAAEIPPQ